MKESKYNRYINVDNRKYLYNLRTQALILLEDDITNFNNLNEEYTEILFDNEFLLPDDLSEMQLIKNDYYKTIINSKELHISIMTTLNCNFRCTYCFEKKSVNYAKENMIIKIKELILEYKDTIKLVTVDWYGGEPLLNLKFIETTSNEIISLCNEFGLIYNATITTNGYLLSENVARKLKKLNVTSAQVSIDGPKEVHDKRRFLINGEGSFDEVFKNCICVQKYIHIDIRVNIDERNYQSVFNLLDMFSNEDIYNISFIFNGVVSAEENPIEEELELKGRKLSDCIFKLNKYAFDKGLNIGILKIFDATKNYFCIVDSLSQFIISPDGKIFKCGESYTEYDNACVGNIYNENKIDLVKLVAWLKDPFNEMKCNECPILPMCYGGCQMKKRNNLDYCPDDIKYHIDDYIKLYIKRLGE